MSVDAPRCPKCGTPMDAGFVLDQATGAFAQISWIEGAPELSFWERFKFREHRLLPVTTYRCQRCGYLESYAGGV